MHSIRKEAKLAGDTRYFTGNPCPQGHIAERMTASGTCFLCLKELAKHWRSNNKQKNRDKQKLKKQLCPEKHNARNAVKRAVDSGQIVKPISCSKCNKGGEIEGHHSDYSKPLEVEWLCIDCHLKEHGNERVL